MVGNSEDADIAPAVRLGMRTILVAIEDPAPNRTAADACVTGLDQVLAVLRSWAVTEPHPGKATIRPCGRYLPVVVNDVVVVGKNDGGGTVA